VIGIFNVESRQRAAFNEDDRQFAEIFGRYVAIALNILDLMVVERVRHGPQGRRRRERRVAGPLNDIASDASALMDDYIGHDDLRHRLRPDPRQRRRHPKEPCARRPKGPNTVDPRRRRTSRARKTRSSAARRSCWPTTSPTSARRSPTCLRKYHATVTPCANGAEAIAKLDEQDFDLVISDIKMPDKTGYDVFAAARKKSQTIPVILMTGFGYDPNHCIVRASQEGLQAVLFKPFKVDQFLAKCARR
jgi:CheY-like chemotaxis protein